LSPKFPGENHPTVFTSRGARDRIPSVMGFKIEYWHLIIRRECPSIFLFESSLGNVEAPVRISAGSKFRLQFSPKFIFYLRTR
jgi:hypothetical protein